MKLIIVFLFVGFSLSCAEQRNPHEEANLILANLRAKDAEAEKAELKRKAKESVIELKKTSASRAKEFKLSDLQSRNLQNDDLEIRIIRLAAFNDRNIVFQLNKSNGKWSAKLIEKLIAKKDLAKKTASYKLSQRQLTEPKSGWETFYQKLISEELLTLPDGNEVGNEACPDCPVYIVETKNNNNYRVYGYHAPEYFKNIREAQQLVKVINTISDEFDLRVFDKNNFQLP